MSATIIFYHSSGSDTGGAITNSPIGDGLNNLFDTLSAQQSRDGLIDYRCFYIKNTSATYLRNAKLYIASQRGSGSVIDVGYKRVDEIQKINISGAEPPQEGDYLEFQIPTANYDTIFKVEYSPNITEWHGNFQTEMRAVNGFRDVLVEVSGSIGYPTDVTFTLNFLGSIGARDLTDLIVATNAMSNSPTINISEFRVGSPVNTTAPTIGSYTTAPANIEFSYPTVGNPLLLGDLRPDDIAPIWARRTTPAHTLLKLIDNFVINVDGVFP